jgi:hypothetical protein
VGLVGLDVELASISDVEVTGDAFSISGQTWDMSYVEATKVRAQFAGYLDEVVPIVSDDLPDLNGFYQFISATVEARSDKGPFGIFGFSLRVQRVQGFTAPLFESVLLGAPRADVSANAAPFHGLPASVKGYETGVLTPSAAVRLSETGDVVVFTDSTDSLFDARPQYFVPAEDWYAGAATVTVNGSTVVGRQVMNDPDGWMLSNGMIRLIGVPGGWFRTEAWDGSEWGNPGQWAPGRRIAPMVFGELEEPHTLTVMRNTPQSVIIRLTADAASLVAGSQFAVTVDIELRRGSMTADVYLASRGSYAWNMITPITYPWVSLTNGVAEGGMVVAYSDDVGVLEVGDGSKAGLIFPANTFNVGIGYHWSSGINTAQNVVNQWAAVQSENVTVAAR